MRVVVDTNVLVAGLRSRRGASFSLLNRVVAGDFQMAISVPLYVEYQDVLSRPGMLPASIPQAGVQDFLRYLCSIAHRQSVFYLWRPWLRDPKDDMVLETALASRSSCIITHNVADFRPAEARRQFGLGILTPGDFLEEQRGSME